MLEQAFTDYLRVEKQYAVNTLQAYSRDLSDFAQFLETQSGANLFSHEGATSVDHRLLRSWMGELMSEGKGARTVARKLSCIKSYYHFLQKAGYVDHNPALRVKVPKFEKKLPAFLKETETEHLLDHLEFPTGFDGIRDRCLLEVLYGCGLRRAEVISLKKAEVDLYGRQIRVKGKGNKERIVPFGKPVYEAVLAYQQAVEAAGWQQEAHFFLRKNGQPMYPKLVYRLVKKYISQVSSVAQQSPHILRHTYATHMLDHGADLNAIKELLGHNSLASTQVYTHNSIKKLKSVHKQAHPRAEKHKNDSL